MEYGLFPIKSGWISQEYKPGVHKGIDVGWLLKDGEHIPCRAWKSGEVIASGTDSEGGVYVVIRHEDNQWSGYWHLVKGSNIAKGTVVQQGDTVGIRGNTGLSSGTHLHFLITKTGMPTLYTYNKMVANTVDPIPLCYKYSTDNIECADSHNQYPLPIMPEKPKTVVRNSAIHQVEVLATALRVRTAPSLSADIYCVADKGLYNVSKQTTADGYVWDEIDTDRWIATNEDAGWTVDYPSDSEYAKEIEALNSLVSELTDKIANLNDDNARLAQEADALTTKNKSLTSKNKSLSNQLTAKSKALEEANVKITNAITALS